MKNFGSDKNTEKKAKRNAFSLRHQCEVYKAHKAEAKEINAENYPSLTFAVLVISLIILLSRFWIGGRTTVSLWVASGIQLGLALLLFLFAVITEAKKYKLKHRQLISYLTVSLFFLTSALSGTFLLPATAQAFTFDLMLVSLPLFIVDLPQRKFSFTLAWMALFLLADSFAKGVYTSQDNLSVFSGDAVHLLEFGVASITTQYATNMIALSKVEEQAKAEYNSRHRMLTGLKNRYALKKDLEDYKGGKVAVIMLDIDEFKFFNDTYGHAVGDRVINEIGNLLKKNFGEEKAYSYGGDEFLIVDTEAKSEEEVRTQLQKLWANKGYVIEGGEVILPNFSAGYVYGYAKDGESVMSEMVRQADNNLYEAKNKGGDSFVGGPYVERAVLSPDQHVSYTQTKMSLDNALMRIPNYSFFLRKAKDILDGSPTWKKENAVAVFSFNGLPREVPAEEYEDMDNLINGFAKALRKEFPQALIAYSMGGQFFVLWYSDEIEAAADRLALETKELSSGKVSLKCGIVLCSKSTEVEEAVRLSSLAADKAEGESKTYLLEELPSHPVTVREES